MNFLKKVSDSLCFLGMLVGIILAMAWDMLSGASPTKTWKAWPEDKP